MVATSHPLAASAALGAWERGGNAVDAAVAAAAMLTVVDPRSTGIGGDLFAQVWLEGAGAPVCLSAAGPAPAGLSMEALHAAGFQQMPTAGPWTITVPGSVAGWEDLVRTHGNLDLAAILDPAIRTAREGAPVAHFVAEEWAACVGKLQGSEEAARTFLPAATAPKEGDRFANPALGEVLRRIADEGADCFYRGEIGEAIGETVEAAGGPMRAGDMASWSGPEWDQPIRLRYRGFDVYELPPPGQGLVTLQALGIYEGFESPDVIAEDHLAIESLKMGFADADRFVTDMRFHDVPVTALLSAEYLADRRRHVDLIRAGWAHAGNPSDTVYVATADTDISCSLIQSLYEGFGSGVVVPGTGIALHNRGAGFVMDEDHVNRPEPGKRPYHTIIPAMLGDDRGFFGCLGVVGGFMQPQGQFQVIRNLFDRGMSPTAAVTAPRFRFTSGRSVAFEPAYDQRVMEALGTRGHEVSELKRFEAGGAQMVLRSEGGFVGASDPRKDGIARGM